VTQLDDQDKDLLHSLIFQKYGLTLLNELTHLEESRAQLIFEVSWLFTQVE